MRLSELKKGEEAVITGFTDELKYVQLMEMGCIPGEKVSLVSKAPFGDPISIQIGNYKLSIRKSEAQNIFIDLLSKEEQSFQKA